MALWKIIRRRLRGCPQGARRGRYPQRCRLGAWWPLRRPAARQQRGNRAVSCPCQPSDVLRPVCKALLPLWRGPCGHIARCQGEQGQTARRRFRRHVRQARQRPIPRTGREGSSRPLGCGRSATKRQAMRRFGLRRLLPFPGGKRRINFDPRRHASFDARAVKGTRHVQV